jgi:hypothetical protein
VVRRSCSLVRFVAAMLLVVCARSGVARAQAAPEAGADYDAESPAWNGLSELTALARVEGNDVIPTSRLDWADLGEGDVLFLIYPTDILDPANVATFVRRGGRLLIADDLGRGDLILARFGIVREPGTVVTGARRYRDNPHLPIAAAWDEEHALARGVSELQTNHPSVFRVGGAPDQVFGFGPGQAVVVAGTLGKGRFVALSDPSVLINRMLAFEGNGAFALNLIHFLGDGEPRGRVFVMSGRFDITGSPPRIPDEWLSANETIGEVDRVLDEWNDYLAPDQLLRALSWGFSGVAMIVAVAVLPWRRRREMDAGFARAREPERQGFLELVGHYDDAGASGNYAYPASLLRDRLDLRLSSVCRAADPLTTVPPEDLVRRVQGRAGLDAAQLVARDAARLRKLPPRHVNQSAWPHMSRREFERIQDDVEELEKALAAEPPLPPPEPTRLGDDESGIFQ